MRIKLFTKRLLLVFIFLPFTAFSQVTQQWVQRYSSPGDSYDIPQSMTADRFGNVYVTGTANITDPSIAPVDYVTIKYNSAGVQLWVSTYNGPGNDQDRAAAITTDFSGNVYVTGKSFGGSGADFDYATIKYNSAGVQQWVARYNGGFFIRDEATAITVDGAGNVYVTGFSVPSPHSRDFVTIKYDASGVLQWVRKIDGNFPNAIALDFAGNVYVSGWSGLETTRGVTVKYNPVGIQLWVQHSRSQVNDMVVDVLGNVYITGIVFPTPAVGDFSTVKYNTNGVMQWEQDYDAANSFDLADGIAVDILGNVYVTGSSATFDPGFDFDYTTIKYNGAGVQQWVSNYNGPGNNNDYAHSIAVDILGNAYVTGMSVGAGRSGTFDYTTIKYNSAGSQTWEIRYDGTANNYDEASELVLNSPGNPQLFSFLAIGTNIYITGVSEGIGTGKDIVTIKYVQPFIFTFFWFAQAPASTGLKKPDETSSELLSNYRISNFPNPFYLTTKIIFDLPIDSRVSIKVYDLYGRQVATLLNEERKRGSYMIDYNASSLKHGVYYCNIIAESSQGRFTQTKKMVKLF